MRLITFASGSTGNCALLQGCGANVLIDAGISYKRIRQGVERFGVEMDALDGVVITHEHDDHVRGLPMLLKYTDLNVYAPGVVGLHLAGRVPAAADRLRRIRVGEPFLLRNLSVTAFSTPHDTDESVGYLMEGAEGRLGFCTDTGSVTEEMVSALCGCDAALIEANHDPDMLRLGRYPWPLKRRILSPRGHLSNPDCAALACTLAHSGVRSIALGHLSRENNTPDRAYSAVREALDGEGFRNVRLAVAPEDGDLIIEVDPCCACN